MVVLVGERHGREQAFNALFFGRGKVAIGVHGEQGEIQQGFPLAGSKSLQVHSYFVPGA